MQLFGGRGAASARNGGTYRFRGKDHTYGDEYKTLVQFGNVKVIKINEGAPTAPMETQTKDRIYATVDDNNEIKYITFYDSEGKKEKQFDLKGKAHHGIEPPHTHEGYEHNGPFHDMTKEEWNLTYRILRMWDNYKKGFNNGF